MIAKCLMLFCIVLLGAAQDSFAVNPKTALSQYAHTALRLHDGLLGSAPESIALTQDGYLWVMTSNDILRFDGLRFTSFSEISGQHLPLARSQTLYGASDGSLWIGNDSYVYRWKDKGLTRYAIPGGRVYTIKEDSRHVIWIGRGHRLDDGSSGACRVIDAAITCLPNAFGQDFAAVSAIAAESSGAIWLKSITSFARYDSVKLDFTLVKALSKVAGLSPTGDIDPDSNGGVWVGFIYAGPGLGLEHFQKGKFHRIRIGGFDSSKLQVQSVFTDRDGALWVGTADDGLLRIVGDQVQRYNQNDGLSGTSVSKILQDREGTIWVMTNQGIDRFGDLTAITYSVRLNHNEAGTSAILADRDNRLWVSSPAGIDILDAQDAVRLDKTFKVPGGNGTSLLRDHNGDFWFGVDQNLYHLTKGILELVLREDSRPVGLVGYLTEDRSGVIWVSIFGQPRTNLLAVTPGEHTARIFRNDLAISAGTLADVHSGIWVLDRSKVLAHIENFHVNIVASSVLSKLKPQSVYQGADGTVYVWCLEGLVLIRGSEIKTIRDDIGSCQIYASIIDKTGSMWSAGLCGLIEIDKAHLGKMWTSPMNALKDRRLFDASDGFDSGWSTFSPSLALASDGRLWFTSGRGANVVDPSHLAINYTVPPVKIESLTADHHKMQFSPLLKLPARTHDLEIDYTALSFINIQKVIFRYKLDGSDHNWQDAGTRRQAFYTNLSPGHYTFHVIARNASGVWNQEGAAVRFDIAPTWYQTLWFNLVAATTIILALVVAYLLRVRTIAARIELRLNARMSERMRLSRELHDTLLQSLQGMVLRFSSFTERVSPEIKTEMERSLDDAEWLLVSGRDRIKEMRGHYSHDGNVTSEIHQILDSLFNGDGCKVDVAVQGNPVPLHSVVHDDTMWIAREALTNACRHSKAEHLDIQITYAAKEFRLMIQDDGIGVNANAFLAHYSGHFGLIGMRERAEAMGARFNVRSNNGNGTSILLSLPARVAFAPRRNWWNKLFNSQ